MSYKIGDRIKVMYEVDGINLTDAVGTIIKISGTTLFDHVHSIGIQFDEKIEEGHDCDGAGKHGYCRYASKFEIVLLKKKQPIDCHKLNKILCLKKATV